jgi:uncharacterized membrane protein YdjX (TVP38/TMEM64 family)
MRPMSEADSKPGLIPKTFLVYVLGTSFILGLLRWAGILSLLTCTLAWLGVALVCTTWALELIAKQIEELRRELEELRKKAMP